MSKIRKAWLNLITCRAPADRSYKHWYCQKRRWHARQTPAKGLVSFAHVHRYNNYSWRDGDSPKYEPIPFDVAPRNARTTLTPRKRAS